ncbi:Os12g0283300, partial [Oryza sativa Japonica Group]
DLRRHDLISPPHLYPLCPHFPRFRGHLGDGGGKFGSAGRESRLPYPGLEQWLEYCPEGGISSLITCGPAPSASSHVVSHTPNPSLIPVQRSVSCPTQVASYPRGRSPMVGLTRKSSSPWLTGWSRRPAPPSTGCSTSSATVSGSSMLRLLRGGRMHGNQGDEGIEGERMCSTAAQCENRSKINRFRFSTINRLFIQWSCLISLVLHLLNWSMD